MSRNEMGVWLSRNMHHNHAYEEETVTHSDMEKTGEAINSAEPESEVICKRKLMAWRYSSLE